MPSRYQAIPELSATGYQPSELHSETCTWREKNCYVDIWIEVLHALGLQAEAVMPFTAAIDFEGDQWTFFKPPHGELWDLYGVDVQELTVWQPLLQHCIEHLGAGKLVSTESDAFWLPDTSGTDYRSNHVKTTIVVADIDVAQQRMGYFHNASYHELSGEDFVRTFRVGEPHDPTFLPLFAETIRFDRIVRRPAAELAVMSAALWRSHARRIPARNPIERFEARLVQDFPAIQAQGLPHYHAWAFATLRQVGASFELAARSLTWMHRHHPQPQAAWLEAAEHFDQVATLVKPLLLRLARAVNSKKPSALEGSLSDIAGHWAQAMAALEQGLQ